MKYMSDQIAASINEAVFYGTYRDYVWPLWERYLEPHGVKAPPEYGTVGAAQLSLLAFNYPNTFVVTKTLAVDTLRRLRFQFNDLQELRHLGKQGGFYIAQSDMLRGLGVSGAQRGDYRLLTLEQPLPGWNPYRRVNERHGIVDGECSYCHGRAGEINPKFRTLIGAVKFYHADPQLPLDTANRVVQCDICNRTLQDRYAYFPVDHVDHGQVRRVLRDLG